mmetsp:Transcript_28466/g.66120  ORF Transcript_28466/g.66120 Transcript_28466/m.66120 type:complete len:80 (+) Transcript_28466:306-545(+)
MNGGGEATSPSANREATNHKHIVDLLINEATATSVSAKRHPAFSIPISPKEFRQVPQTFAPPGRGQSDKPLYFHAIPAY